MRSPAGHSSGVRLSADSQSDLITSIETSQSTVIAEVKPSQSRNNATATPEKDPSAKRKDFTASPLMKRTPRQRIKCKRYSGLDITIDIAVVNLQIIVP